jgi:membrane-bound metal-dependent hydrolase YbcI (DUF457 family)
MPSPVGHSLSGIAAYLLLVRSKRSYLLLLFFIFFANLPDLDFIPGWLVNQPNLFHRGLSHSFFMAGMIGVTVGLVVRLAGRGKALPAAMAVIFLCCFHIILDLFSVDYGTPPGFKILWPFRDEHYIAPNVIFMNITRSPLPEEFFRSLFNTHNLKAVINEIVIFLPLLLLVWGSRGRGRNKGKSAAETPYVAIRSDQEERWVHRAFRET